jgi:hypothetical protein
MKGFGAMKKHRFKLSEERFTQIKRWADVVIIIGQVAKVFRHWLW